MPPGNLRVPIKPLIGNAIRDLLGLQVDVLELLPPDDNGYGFDNIGIARVAGSLSFSGWQDPK